MDVQLNIYSRRDIAVMCGASYVWRLVGHFFFMTDESAHPRMNIFPWNKLYLLTGNQRSMDN